MSTASRVKQQEKMNQLEEMVATTKSKMNSWNSLVENVNVPLDFYAALMTGRPELLKVVKPRELTEDECRNVYNLIAVLIETNQELQKHANELSRMVNNWSGAFKQLHSVGQRIERFAKFQELNPEEDDA
jgi:hypothetical protein